MNPTNTSSQRTVQPGLIPFFTGLLSGSSFEIVPLLLFFLYIIGYLCLNTHLSKFPIIETNIISFNYIKASIILIVFNIPLLSASRKLVYGFKNGQAISSLIIVLYVIDVYCLFYFFYEMLALSHADDLSDSEAKMRLKAFAITYGTFLLGWVFSKINNSYLLLIPLFFVVFNIFSFCFLSKACLTLALYLLITLGLAFIVFLIDIVKPNLYLNKKSLFIPLYGFIFALVCMAFGWFVYDKIPQILGGGKSYSAIMYLTKSESQSMQESCVLANDEAMKNQVKIIYSSEKGFYIDDNSSVIVIPIEAVKGIRVKRWFLSQGNM